MREKRTINGTQLYLMTRFSPLIDTLWHSELKVAKVSELQKLGLLRHYHHPHRHHHHKGGKRGQQRTEKSPFKVSSGQGIGYTWENSKSSPKRHV